MLSQEIGCLFTSHRLSADETRSYPNHGMDHIVIQTLLLLLSSFTVISTEGLTATCAAAFELS